MSIVKTIHEEYTNELLYNEIMKINTSLNSFRGYVTNELSSIKTKLENVEDQVAGNKFMISTNNDSINTNKINISTNSTNIDSLTAKITELEDQYNLIKKTSTGMNSLLDDSINRSMRNTLILKGVPETKDETYKQTTETI